MLHRNLIGDGITDDKMYRAIGNSRIGRTEETDANKFAAELLMPRELIAAYKKAGVQSAKELAKTFGVSEHAMSIRIGVQYAAE